MRHTFVSIVRLLPSGAVKEVVGHSKNMDTFGVYGHAIKGEDVNTANMLNTVFEELCKRHVR